jgi:hypothetical protein
MEAWVTRTANGLVAADEGAQKLIDRHAVGSTFPVDIAARTTRSGNWHRRYWVLMTMLSDNLQQVEVEPGMVLPIRNKDDAHLAMKYATGLFDSYIIQGGGTVRLIKSTAFDAMTPDEWATYWKRVLEATHRVFLPGVTLPTVENEIARLAS